jgi:hypothetical protein
VGFSLTLLPFTLGASIGVMISPDVTLLSIHCRSSRSKHASLGM